MRASAILIGFLALSLISCGVEPHVREDSKNELGKLKGPETTTVDAEIAQEAAQAETQGNFKQSVQLYKQLVDKEPANITYQMGYAESLRRVGACNASLKVTDAVIAKDPSNAPALENKGLCLMTTGEFDEAGTAFSGVMKTDKSRWRTLNGIGILFTMKGKYDDAVRYYQAALNISTDNPSVLNNAALTYAIDQQFERSYDAFARAKRHVQEGSADMKHLDLNLALVYAVNGKLDLAEQTASPYLSKEGLYNNMGFYSYLAKNNDMAKGYLNMALTQSPTYYERAWKNLGALTGDPNAGSNQPMPAEHMSGGTNGAPQAVNPAMPVPSTPQAPAPAGVSLDDIPESKTQKVSAIPAQPGSAPVVAVPAASSEPGMNPDVVLLHKPVAAQNGDWDADKKTNMPATPGGVDAAPSSTVIVAPAATPATTTSLSPVAPVPAN